MTNVEWLDPIRDEAWQHLVDVHPEATIFHSSSWIRALCETYGYKARVLAHRSTSGEIEEGVVFCLVQSRITGSRLVSLPFSDHCQPLLADSGGTILSRLVEAAKGIGIGRIQLRPRRELPIAPAGFHPGDRFAFHEIDLSPPLETLFKSFHQSSVQRRIRHAEKTGMQLEVGRTDHLLDTFFRLLLETRRRHGLPPQPRAWFQNLVRFLGEELEIHVAQKEGVAVAAILTLRFRDQLVYKYGCSDARFNSLGATPWLFWKAIETAKERGLTRFDLGRSDLDNPGLIRFKSNWASHVSDLTYWRWPEPPAEKNRGWGRWVKQQVVPRLPASLLEWSGRLLYRHFG